MRVLERQLEMALLNQPGQGQEQEQVPEPVRYCSPGQKDQPQESDSQLL